MNDGALEMQIEHDLLVENGLLDPDQPTRWSHAAARQRARAEFTPSERALIRSLVLGERPTK